MSTLTAASTVAAPSWADKILKGTGILWYLVAIPGQFVFAAYVIDYYWGNALLGNIAAWGEVLPHGIEPDTPTTNAATFAHLLVVALMIFAGAIQLATPLRRWAPRLHRWSGRVFLLTSCTGAVSGLTMVALNGSAAGPVGSVSVSLNGVLILLFARPTVRHAMTRRIDRHRRWALRLFLVAHGVWFFRIGLFFWFAVMGTVGIDTQTFRGPTLYTLGFAQYVIPLAVLQLYLAAQDSRNDFFKLLTALIVLVLTAGMGLGIFAATMGLWLPRM